MKLFGSWFSKAWRSTTSIWGVVVKELWDGGRRTRFRLPQAGQLAHEREVLIRACRGKDLLALYGEIDAHLDNCARIQNAARSAHLLERTEE
ncbi:phosphoheptose isomerase family protein [Mycolicibacterium neoaurum]|uniref:Uncharacterized protein n=1 Tax=Mycolicibacterium neoaurum VKM Ac-1815D TaxID=700508 RepID=V5XHR7_MYCNE|nr:hypothetical protein D174_16760 [Mycolicibacterium neoaurum VKM Ac-1815D]AMO06502.1 hypothetical protein MyAD_16435 [Mycolicibacterium neoaurum]KJQ51165.1 hypothetical protein TS71_07865 [Mycolicibacterium neoaurum]